MIKIIGRGGFGKVTLVERNSDKKLYALKSMKKAQIIEKGQYENILNERKILEQVIFIIKFHF